MYNLLGMKTKDVNINRQIQNLWNFTCGTFLENPQTSPVRPYYLRFPPDAPNFLVNTEENITWTVKHKFPPIYLIAA